MKIRQKFKLTEKEVRELLYTVRWRFVSHELLYKVSREELLQPYKDILLEAFSCKLKQYEDIASHYSINLDPRKSYRPG